MLEILLRANLMSSDIKDKTNKVRFNVAQIKNWDFYFFWSRFDGCKTETVVILYYSTDVMLMCPYTYMKLRLKKLDYIYSY